MDMQKHAEEQLKRIHASLKWWNEMYSASFETRAKNMVGKAESTLFSAYLMVQEEAGNE